VTFDSTASLITSSRASGAYLLQTTARQRHYLHTLTSLPRPSKEVKPPPPLAPSRPRVLTHLPSSPAIKADMASSHTLESQNNAALSQLSQKITALRGVTVDIYDQSRNHELIDSNTDAFTGMGNNLRGSAGRLTRMAQSGNKVAILKLSGIIIGVVIVLWWVLGWFFGGSSKS
jgi:blocked-early-in-transport protein 1